MIPEEAKLTIEYLKGIQEGYIEVEGYIEGEGYERHPLPEWYALDKAIETIEQTRWIPVSERLPEDKTYVLTTIKVPNRIAHARSSWYECGFFHNDNGDTWRATDMEVKAWMPLPEPYEPQERSEKG